MPRPVSRVELSRIFGVTRAAVTKRCQGAWAAACDGDRVNLDHPLIQAAARKKGIDLGEPAQPPTPPAKKGEAKSPVPTKTAEPIVIEPSAPTKRRQGADKKPELPEQPDGAGSDEDLNELGRAVQPLVPRFGTARGFRDWLLGLKEIEVIRAKRLAYASARDLLVPREFIEMHVFGLIEGANHRLLTDTPRTLCRELYTLAKSGAPLEEAEAATRKLIGKQLESVKAKAVTAMRNARSGADRGHEERPRLGGAPSNSADD